MRSELEIRWVRKPTMVLILLWNLLEPDFLVYLYDFYGIRQIQVLVIVILWEFDSPRPHKIKRLRDR